jgi:hypothetical protein
MRRLERMYTMYNNVYNIRLDRENDVFCNELEWRN